MSFTTEIKQEIAYNELRTCCTRAELSALIQLTSSLTIEDHKLGLLVRTENPTTARRVVSLMKNLFGIKSKLTVTQKTNLKKNNVYTLRIDGDAEKILEELGLYNEKGLLDHPRFFVIKKDCCARAYLAGCFLAYGSCNSPSRSNYHLEISFDSSEHAEFVHKLIDRFNIESKISTRRGKTIVYMKKADSISDFLRLIGAHESLMNFENSRINRDFRNSLTRLDNCEIANEMKSLDASRKQLDAIGKIIAADKLDDLDEKLRNVADLRMKYQDSSLLELCEEYQHSYGDSISKSGLKHRFDRIEEIAKGL